MYFLPIVHVRELHEFMLLMARAHFGMAGCLSLVLLVRENRRVSFWINWLTGRWSGFWVPILWMRLASGPHLIFLDPDDLASEIGEHPCLWTDGSLEPHPTAGSAVVGAGVYLPAPELAMQVPSGRI